MKTAASIAALLTTSLLSGTAQAGSKHDDALSAAVRADDVATLQATLKSRDAREPLLIQAVLADARGVLAALLDAGTPVDGMAEVPAWGETATPLLVALAAGRTEAADLLLSRGASPKATTSGGWTALHLLADGRGLGGGLDPAWVATLVAAGVDVDARTTTTGSTALHLAAARNRVPLVRALLAAGAQGLLRDAAGRTPAVAIDACGAQSEAYLALFAGGAATVPDPLCDGTTADTWKQLTQVADIRRQARDATTPAVPPRGEAGWREAAVHGLAAVDAALTLDEVLAAGFAEDRTPVCSGGRWCRATLPTDNTLLCRATAMVLTAADASWFITHRDKGERQRIRLDCTGEWVDVVVRYPGNAQVMAELEHFRGDERLWVQSVGFTLPE